VKCYIVLLASVFLSNTFQPIENTFDNLAKYTDRDLTCTAAPLSPQEQQEICHQYNEVSKEAQRKNPSPGTNHSGQLQYAKVQIRPFHAALHEKFFYTLSSNSSAAGNLYDMGETYRAFILVS